MKQEDFTSFNKLSEWEIYFNNLLYNPDTRINEIIGTIESELNYIFSQIIHNDKSLNLFWEGLINTFCTIPPYKEYINVIYDIILFLKYRMPILYLRAIRELIVLGRLNNLKLSDSDEFDLNDLLINNLITQLYKPDKFLEAILLKQTSNWKPYYFYLLSSYYYNTGQPILAIKLLKSFLSSDDSQAKRRSYSNCLYAYDENIPKNITWFKVVASIANTTEILTLGKSVWQFQIFKNFINNRPETKTWDSNLSRDEQAFIILFWFFNSMTTEYEMNILSTRPLESKKQITKILSYMYETEAAYRQTPESISIVTNAIEVLTLYDQFKKYEINK